MLYKNTPSDNQIWGPIEHWRWGGKTSLSNANYTQREQTALVELHKLIKNADATECLTSKSDYIRGCKKWLMENE